jgi:hypothetical protein
MLAVAAMLMGAGCRMQSAEPEAMLEAVIAAAQRDEPTLLGESSILMNDLLIYRQEMRLDGASLTILPGGAQQAHGRSQGEAALWIGWDGLREAAEEVVQEAAVDEPGAVVLRVRLDGQAAKRTVVHYLEGQFNRVRERATGIRPVSADVEAYIAEQEANLRNVLDTLQADTVYRLYADRRTSALRRLDVQTRLRYTRDGAEVEETITGSYRAVAQDPQDNGENG